MNFRTDLALERFSLNEIDQEDQGYTTETEDFLEMKITKMKITEEAFAKKIGKSRGDYITIETTPFSDWVMTTNEYINKIGTLIASLLPKNGSILVVGLGNIEITPDAIGPKTLGKILATRHISQEIIHATGLGDLRSVAAISPSVLGKTGIETKVFLDGIIETVNPSALIVIDALACRDVRRLGSTIQISNTGISPGAGVGNFRQEISEKTVGIPVIAIGVPTVVDAITLTMDVLGIENPDQIPKENQEKMQSMMVTPREVDLLIDRACSVLSFSINKALQPHIDVEDMTFLLS